MNTRCSHADRGAEAARRAAWRDARGYTIIELMIATGIMVVVTGAIFSMMNPAQGTFRVQPEVSDVQQRMRVSADTLYKDLIMAGAGPYQGATVGGLINYFSPILPRRSGQVNADNYDVYKDDTITLTFVPNTYSQTTISAQMPAGSAEMKVNNQPNCPQGQELCGFTAGMEVLLFDANGNFDVLTITKVQDQAGHLQHRGQGLSTTYGAGTAVTQVQSHTYWLDRTTSQLKHYDGYQTDLPVVDNVVDLKFTYFGEANPPRAPVPVSGQANCVIDAAGQPRLADLGDGLVQLVPATLNDGLPAWCGTDAQGLPTKNAYDPDLLRIRKIRVDLRVQVAAPDLRGTDTSLFLKPGTASGFAGLVPDYRVSFEVTPRNLNLMR